MGDGSEGGTTWNIPENNGMVGVKLRLLGPGPLRRGTAWHISMTTEQWQQTNGRQVAPGLSGWSDLLFRPMA